MIELFVKIYIKLAPKIHKHPETVHVVCFTVEDYEDAYQRDSEVITKLEKNLAAMGAIPARIDFPSKQCCVTITDSGIEPKDIQQVLETVGLRITLMETETITNGADCKSVLPAEEMVSQCGYFGGFWSKLAIVS
jgi:hypothetical protein